MKNPGAERGFILLSVVVAITLVAAIAFALSYQGANETNITSGELERDQLRYVAEAGMAHAKLQLGNNTSCSGYANLPTTLFGGDSYSATISPNSNSPVTITAIGTLANGVETTLTNNAIRTYQTSTAVVLQLGKTGGKDTLIDRFYDSQNFGAVDDLIVSSNPSWMRRSLLEFDLSAIPAGAKLISAKLELKQRILGTPGVIGVHRVSQNWGEGTGKGTGNPDGATWLEYDGVADWAQPGGDFDSTLYATAATTSGKNGQWLAWDIRNLVDEWVSGKFPNYGLILVGDGVVDNAEFESREEPDPTAAPKLTIVFACECGVGGSSATLMLQPGVEGKEAMLRDTKNYGAAPYTWIDTNVPYHSLYEFDLSSLAPGAMITSALLDIHQSSADVVTMAADLDVHRVTTAWVEGTGDNSGLSPPDGVTWDTSDGTTPWNSAGGDYDSAVIDSTIVNSTTSAWHQWNVTNLVQGWVDGTYSNYGFLLRASSGNLEKLYLDTGEDNDPAVHPKLTINYSCPCGADCLVPGGGSSGKRILFVVGDPASLTAQQQKKKTLIEGWGHSVTLIATSESQAAFDTAAALVDVVYVPELGSGPMGELDTKADDLSTAVITEEARRALLLGSWSLLPFVDADSINISDNTHYITETLPIGNVQLSTTVQSMWVLKGTLALDLHVLGELNGTEPGLAYLEGGARRNDASLAPARRVKLPWGSYDFDPNNLTAQGLAIMKRAIEWGAGAGPPPPAPGYLDQFNVSTCDSAADYSGSDGAIDWSPWAWTEVNELDGSCAGQIRVATDPDIDDAGSFRLRVASQGVRVYRTVDLAGFSNPTLSFDYRLTDYPALDFMRLRVFDGVGYNEITRFDGPLDHAAYQSASFDLSAYAGLEIQVQFEFNGTSTTRTSYIDNVHIQEGGGGGGGSGGDGDITFEEFAEASLDIDGLGITVPKPAGTTAGDLLIAAVVTDAEQKPAMTAPSGWTLIDHGSTSKQVTMDVLWKIADASEPGSYDFSWVKSQQAYAWIMRFTGHDPAAPIHDSQSGGSTSSSPASPAVSTTVANAMIVRIGGFDDDDIAPGDPGLPGHTAITMGASGTGTGTASGGAGYVSQSAAGDSGTSNFSLTSSEEYRAVTIAIAPAP